MRSRAQGAAAVEVSRAIAQWLLAATRGFRSLCDMRTFTWSGWVLAFCVGVVALGSPLVWSAGTERAAEAPSTTSTVAVVDVAVAADTAVRLGRVVPTTSTVARTIGACVPVGLETPNSWRAALGLDLYLWSQRLYDGACAWATHLAQQGGMMLYHEPGPYAETLYVSNTCDGMWTTWHSSSGHYAAWASKTYPEGVVTYAAVAIVTDSTGRCWGVGRVDTGGSS